MALNVLVIADSVSPALYDHFCPERWGTVDLVLSAGDLPPDYLDFLCSALNVPLLYVRGNHDGAYAASQYAGSDDVHGRIVTVKGVRVAGFQGCRWYNGGPYQYTEQQMKRVVQRVERQARRIGAPDIVLTHAPPAGCHDAPDRCHQGFACFREAIGRWQPAYFIHGHVHAYQGTPAVTQIGRTTVINAYPFRGVEVRAASSDLERTRESRPGWVERVKRGVLPGLPLGR